MIYKMNIPRVSDVISSQCNFSPLRVSIQSSMAVCLTCSCAGLPEAIHWNFRTGSQALLSEHMDGGVSESSGTPLPESW